ncbi:serine hydrolase domain-containing protein [Nibrella saemangeumensis]
MKTKHVRERLSRLLIVLGCVGIAAAPVQAQKDSVDLFMQQAMTKHHIPGAAVAVVKNGKILKVKTYGYANLAWQNPVTPETPFQLASGTKPLTGTLLGVLLQEGKLSLDDKVSKYLDSIPDAWKTITIRQLAAHQSGIKLVPLETTKTIQEGLKTAAAYPMEYEPGTKEFYVSSDYLLLQHIIAKVTGLSFTEALRQKVLVPLKMADTQFSLTQDDGLFRTARVIPKVAEVYSWSKDHYSVSDMRFPDWFYAAGGAYSSIRDLANMMVAYDKNTLLKPETKNLLYSRVKLLNGADTHWGIGWLIENYQGHTLINHSGGPALSDIDYFPKEGLSVVVLTNARGGFPPYLARAIARYYIPGLKMPQLPN